MLTYNFKAVAQSFLGILLNFFNFSDAGDILYLSMNNCIPINNMLFIDRQGCVIDCSVWNKKQNTGLVITEDNDTVTMLEFVKGKLDGIMLFRDVVSNVLDVYKRSSLINRLIVKDDEFCNFIFDGSYVIEVTSYPNGTIKKIEKVNQSGLIVFGEYFSPDQTNISRVLNGNGIRVDYNKDGAVICVDDIKDGLMCSRKLFLDNHNVCETTYKNNMKNGYETLYSEDGRVLRQSQYKDDLRDGMELEFHDTGSIKSEAIYKHGKLQDDVLFF